ncbi:MAG: (deoxy)nucleoside triphosphate pyrophosphohydrolase [Gammaproteobacteria bacterium]|nr:(deoxy)nucleoside triphosphate pyrophosphohydrolase [Gammaproteobacteria bacterium]
MHVVAGVLGDGQGRVLVTQRTAGRELAGYWDFPGGKVAAGEAPLAALRRELREELGIELRDAAPLLRYQHGHQGRVVLLDVWMVQRYDGEPSGLEGQPLRWEAVDRLLETGLLEADRPIVEALLGRGPLSTS